MAASSQRSHPGGDRGLFKSSAGAAGCSFSGPTMCVLELLRFRFWKKQLKWCSIGARFALASYSGV